MGKILKFPTQKVRKRNLGKKTRMNKTMQLYNELYGLRNKVKELLEEVEYLKAKWNESKKKDNN
jgi:uncharacterized protein YlxW (UPF0749 family)